MLLLSWNFFEKFNCFPHLGTFNEEFLEDHNDAKHDDDPDWDVSKGIRNGHERKSSTKLRKSKKAFKSKIEPFANKTSDEIAADHNR